MSRQVGFFASTEQFGPHELLEQCVQAERVGFRAIMASDHFHPWTPQQGQSPFVWTWLGALGREVSLPFGTAVSAPGDRYHPTVLAQAAATVEAMYPGRFRLGLGAGEALNEHITGGYWPEPQERVARLLEAVGILRRLFQGEVVRHQGRFFRVESARLYTLPETPPPIFIATSGPYLSRKTGELCDALMTVGASEEKIRMLLENFAKGARAAGKDPASMPRMLLVHVSWAPTLQEAVDNALHEWPNGGMNFPKGDIRRPEDFEALARMVRPEHFQGRVLISSRAEEHVAFLRGLFAMGFEEIHVHNCGRNQSEFLDFYGREVLPEVLNDRPADSRPQARSG
jgi:G6PDH family F420-dependent oxidoreductase